MKLATLILSIILAAAAAASGQPTPPALTAHETAWNKHLAEITGGDGGVVCWDGSRPDLVCGEFAIEVDRAHKWREAIGQAFFYADQLDKKPAVVILVETLDVERSELWRAVVACRRAGVALHFFDMRRNRFILETRKGVTDE